MIVGRIIGWLLILLAIAVAGHEAVMWLDGGTYRTLALGKLWFTIDAASLNITQAAVQRYLWAWLWDGVAVNLLLIPAWAFFGVPGLLLAWFYRGRRGRRRGFA